MDAWTHYCGMVRNGSSCTSERLRNRTEHQLLLTTTVYARSIMQHYYTYITPWIFPHLPYFLEISPRWDFISRPYLVRQQFKGSVYRDRHAHMHTASIISLFVCIYNACAYACKSCWPFTMQWDFEGGIYWDELAETCGNISRVVGFWGVARFRGNMVFALCFEIMV